MSGIGHNSGSEDDTFTVSDEQLDAANESAEELRLLIERIERLEEEKKGIADDIKDVYSEGKAKGFDTKMMRKIIALRKMSPEDRAEQAAILQTYLEALGMA
mgnify:CR=1 FL=1